MSICFTCADDQDCSWPKGHQVRFGFGECSFCHQEKAVCAESDWRWKKPEDQKKYGGNHEA